MRKLTILESENQQLRAEVCKWKRRFYDMEGCLAKLEKKVVELLKENGRLKKQQEKVNS